MVRHTMIPPRTHVQEPGPCVPMLLADHEHLCSLWQNLQDDVRHLVSAHPEAPKLWVSGAHKLAILGTHSLVD